jgi:hypothetical protein
VPERPALLRRLPRLRGAPPYAPILSPENRTAFEDLEPDFRFLDDDLVPEFRRYDEAALADQNRFRRQQLLLIFGGAATTVLGSLHASLGGGWRWLAAAEAVAALFLVGVVRVVQRTQAQRRYLENRLLAERLRAEFFRFVGRVGAYADEAHREQELKRRVAELTARGEA